MMGVLYCNDAMRIMLIGRGYLPNREDYPREALAELQQQAIKASGIR
jgi:hypothetical protein